ncbi:PIG-L deacetylase family protein [Thalassospira povalilytica]|uniref:PIG-L deacetylase family protein n=1 Tax=Thalassospira povalilytica TaxID=732237 RepID=UPI001D18F2DC|nr:PIG-L deacetylase family protein [Thalassospira povalilytica]MCC4240701.1 PIG-L family deacetylase [Thalassospira povalilytica]
MNSNDRVLVIAAHPDDEVLGCGGTIARYRAEGCDVRVVFMAEGITARFSPSEFDTDAVKEKSAKRNADALEAMTVLGVNTDQVFLSERHCCRLDQVPLIELTKQIEDHIREFSPTHLFTHAPDDPNIDHVTVHKAVLPAIRPIKGQHLRGVFAFEVLSSTEWNPLKPYAPTVFQDITDSITQKIAAMQKYESEIHPPPHPRSPEVLQALARFRGAQAGLDYAEGFVLIRGINL